MKNTKSTLFILSTLLTATYASSLMAGKPVPPPEKESVESVESVEKIVDKNCQAPKWAIAIGHEDKWKLHNGCTEEKVEEKKQETTQ